MFFCYHRARKETMNKIISAGFIIKCKDGKFLLGKTGGGVDGACWTIFKGGQIDGESLIETAIRETKEESGIDIASDKRLTDNMSTIPIFSYSVKNKDVYVFYLHDVDGVLDNCELKCSSYYDDNKPEISEFCRFEVDEMSRVVFPSQLGLVKLLKNSKERQNV